MWNSLTKFVEGLILGSVVGYIFGLLSAPKSGAELRKQLADNSEDLYKQASDSLVDISNKTNVALHDLQHKSEEVLKKASATVQEKTEQIGHKLEEISGQGAKVLVDDGDNIEPV